MTTCIGKACIGYQCLQTASSHTILPFGRHETAPRPQIGTTIQLGSSYAGRNNRNKLSYENVFFSYARVPIFRYGSILSNPLRPASSSPKFSRPATNRPRNSPCVFPPSEHKSQAVSKLESEQIAPSKSLAIPESVPSQLRIPPHRPSLLCTTWNKSPSCFKAVIGTEPTPVDCHTPRNCPKSDTDRPRRPAPFQTKPEHQTQGVPKLQSEQSSLPVQLTPSSPHDIKKI